MLGRNEAAYISQEFGNHIINDNVPRAGGMVPSHRESHAAPDAYQLVLATIGTQALSQTLTKKTH